MNWYIKKMHDMRDLLKETAKDKAEFSRRVEVWRKREMPIGEFEEALFMLDDIGDWSMEDVKRAIFHATTGYDNIKPDHVIDLTSPVHLLSPEA